MCFVERNGEVREKAVLKWTSVLGKQEQGSFSEWECCSGLVKSSEGARERRRGAKRSGRTLVKTAKSAGMRL